MARTAIQIIHDHWFRDSGGRFLSWGALTEEEKKNLITNGFAEVALGGADLSGADLRKQNLREVELCLSNLVGVNLEVLDVYLSLG